MITTTLAKDHPMIIHVQLGVNNVCKTIFFYVQGKPKSNTVIHFSWMSSSKLIVLSKDPVRKLSAMYLLTIRLAFLKKIFLHIPIGSKAGLVYLRHSCSQNNKTLWVPYNVIPTIFPFIRFFYIFPKGCSVKLCPSLAKILLGLSEYLTMNIITYQVSICFK